MCRKPYNYCCILTLFSALILNSAYVTAAADDFGVRIFQLQERLAKKGNHLAQFKLGIMYEHGVGVEQDIDEALGWYQKSANQGYTLAKDRITYLEIKHRGFDRGKHGQWLTHIQKSAASLESDSVLLLGQMYHYGVAVERDLDKALALLNRASSEGHTEIYKEIAALKAELLARENKKTTTQQNKKVIEPTPSRKIASPQKKQATIDAEKSKAAKRQRYEESMRKLREEQRIIEEQQKWAEGRK